MQNLIALLKRYSTFLYFIILQILCFILLISNNNFHKTKYWNSSNSVIGWIQETQTNVTEYLYLQQENTRLLDENSRLKEIVFGKQDVTKGDWLKMIDKVRQVKYDYLPARVVANTTQFKKNYITLDVGTIDGVNPEELLGVVGPEGVVGFTKRGGSKHYTQVVSLLHSKFILSAVHAKSGQQGILKWESGDNRFTATVHEFPKYLDIELGDLIVTSGNTGRFPRGELIGEVSNFEEIPGTNFYKVKVKLATDFNSLYHVSVIRNTEILEIQSLEQIAEPDFKPIQ
ncbi:rod shape-determining protein MreC [Flavobacteriales bacterium]|nr:rod shape-determining protein MreC [Flavobacteriales bacterium]